MAKRIVFSTWGSLGDLHPYLALAVEMARRGHRTVVATLPVWRDHVERAGVGFHPVGPDIHASRASQVGAAVRAEQGTITACDALEELVERA